MENRELFVEFCLEEDYVVSSTMFQKHHNDLITFRNTQAATFASPFTNTRFSQIDHILSKRRWRNAIRNVNATHHTSLESDHKMIVVDVAIKLAKQTKKSTAHAPKYREPSDEQRLKYNQIIRQLQGCPPPNFDTTPVTVFAQCLQKAASLSFTAIPPNQRQPYISATAWNLMESRQEAFRQGQPQIAQELTQKIKNEVRKDKETHLLQQLEEMEGSSYSWNGLKRLRKAPRLKYTKFRDKDGRRIPRSEYHHKAAEYLAQEQWKRNPDRIPPPKVNPSNLTNGRFPINDSQFTLEELDAVIRKQPNNKAPGTDNLRAELVKYLDEENRKTLLQFYNDILQSGKLEDSLHEASVVSIFKKGDSTKLENYRPISLLQTCYKLLAAMIKNRLTQGLDDWIMTTQYGFRSGKSTSHAIFLARRLQSIAEITGRNISVVMLDWEKAFDRLDHDRLMESLQRLEVPPRLLQLIKDIYTHPKFQVKCEEGSSAFLRQEAGIRQGCPLSPYLFILVMSVAFSDIKNRLHTPKQLEPLPGIYFSEILYADDTLIFGDHTASINKLLHEIEIESSYYNMNLNYQKCINLTTNQQTSTIKFSDGSLVPRKRQAIYLGTVLNDAADNSVELQNRLALAVKTCCQLKLFWDKANTGAHWKLRVFNAIVRSKLMYGLENLQLTHAEMNKLDAFQMKSLRRILNVPPTFIDRTQTNQVVREQVEQYGVDATNFSQVWKNQKLKLFGHILRANHKDPLRQVLFSYNSFAPRNIPLKRRGRPKLDWLQETIKDAYHALGRVAPPFPTHQDVLQLVDVAALRCGPF